MACGFGLGRHVLVDRARDSRYRATRHGRGARHAHGMVAHRRAVGRGDRHFDGVHQLWLRDGKTVVASCRDRDVRADRCLRDDPWRTEPDSSRDHVARDY